MTQEQDEHDGPYLVCFDVRSKDGRTLSSTGFRKRKGDHAPTIKRLIDDFGYELLVQMPEGFGLFTKTISDGAVAKVLIFKAS